MKEPPPCGEFGSVGKARTRRARQRADQEIAFAAVEHLHRYVAAEPDLDHKLSLKALRRRCLGALIDSLPANNESLIE